jgi:hypothetical protein
MLAIRVGVWPRYLPADRSFRSFFCRSANSSAIALMLVGCSRLVMALMPCGRTLPSLNAKNPASLVCSHCERFCNLEPDAMCRPLAPPVKIETMPFVSTGIREYQAVTAL